MLKQSQVSGHGSTNVQIGYVSASTFNYVTMFVNGAEPALSDARSKLSGSVRQIANEQSCENIRLITGDFKVLAFCIKARVIDIGHPYPKKNDKGEIIDYLSNVFFCDGLGEQFRVTIPIGLVLFAQGTDVTVVFASNANKSLLHCSIHNDASGDNVYLNLARNWGAYLNRREITTLMSCLGCSLVMLVACIYFGFWHVSIVLEIPFIQILFFSVFIIGLTMHLIYDIRQSRIRHLVAEKRDNFLSHLSTLNKPT